MFSAEMKAKPVPMVKGGLYECQHDEVVAGSGGVRALLPTSSMSASLLE